MFFQRLVMYRDPTGVRECYLCPLGFPGLAKDTPRRSETTKICWIDDQSVNVRISGQLPKSLLDLCQSVAKARGEHQKDRNAFQFLNVFLRKRISMLLVKIRIRIRAE